MHIILNIKTGSYFNIERHERKCNLCDTEDEYHFILKCVKYADVRMECIKPYYWRRPSVYKFIELLSVQNVNELNNIGNNCI